MSFFFGVQIRDFAIMRRRIVAAVQPQQETWVRAEAQHLVAQRRNGYLFGFFAPLAPFFPGVTAAPTGHDENSIAIGAVHERFVFEFSFEANCIESHLFDVTKFGFAARFINAKHHIRRPAATANQYRFAVNFEQSVALRSEFGVGLDDANREPLPVRDGGIRSDEFEL